jgi:dihydroorotate oxidase A (EC 1.3.3.1)
MDRESTPMRAPERFSQRSGRLDRVEMTSLYALIRPLLFRLDAERAHDLTAKALRVTSRAPLLPRLIRALYAWEDPLLAVDWSGLHFANPVASLPGSTNAPIWSMGWRSSVSGISKSAQSHHARNPEIRVHASFVCRKTLH